MRISYFRAPEALILLVFLNISVSGGPLAGTKNLLYEYGFSGIMNILNLIKIRFFRNNVANFFLLFI